MDAAATARSMSVELAMGTWRITSPEAGFVMSPFRRAFQVRRFPPIQNGTVSTPGDVVSRDLHFLISLVPLPQP